MATEKSILVTKSSENRRSNKPIMEKRRRARINNCLNDLKTLILEAMKKDPARHSKLEKADILEMTVKHLQNLQRHQMAMSVAADPTVLSKYRAGFNECANEVSRYVSRTEGLDPTIRNRLLNHLANCLAALTPPTNPSFSSTSTTAQGNTTASPVHIQVAGRPAAALSVVPPSLSCDVVGGIQLVPSRLPNGDIAFLLPGGQLASHVIPVYSPNSTSPASVVNNTDTLTTTSSQPVAVQTRVSPACDKPLSVSVASPSRGPLSPSSTVSSNVSTLSPIGSDFSDSSITPNTTPNLRPTTPLLEPENLSARESDTDRMWRPW